jgi:hypothetical protein
MNGVCERSDVRKGVCVCVCSTTLDTLNRDTAVGVPTRTNLEHAHEHEAILDHVGTGLRSAAGLGMALAKEQETRVERLRENPELRGTHTRRGEALPVKVRGHPHLVAVLVAALGSALIHRIALVHAATDATANRWPRCYLSCGTHSPKGHVFDEYVQCKLSARLVAVVSVALRLVHPSTGKQGTSPAPHLTQRSTHARREVVTQLDTCRVKQADGVQQRMTRRRVRKGVGSTPGAWGRG